MAESLAFSKTSDRKTIYAEIAPQIAALVAGETDLVANLANITAVLREAFGFFWVGFYLKKGDQLVLSAFQGPLACTRIDFDKGVCGHAYTTRETVIVPNVEAIASGFKPLSSSTTARAMMSVALMLHLPSDVRSGGEIQ